MKPPYEITPLILELIQHISEKLGEINAGRLEQPKTELRKENRIKTIQASLQIEGNTLSTEQVTAIMDGKRISAPKKDIIEVQNAIKVYSRIEELKFDSLPAFLKAHSSLMQGLLPHPGKLRISGAGIVKGSDLAHLAPPASQVNPLMNDLFRYLKSSKDPLLIRSCVFHYELESIHPFPDGNGRMGRLWQSVILGKQNKVFQYLPVESLIKEKQRDYYNALSASDKKGASTPFIEFMLGMLDQALRDVLSRQRKPLTGQERMEIFRERMPDNKFSRKDYMNIFKEISAATASRDLRDAVKNRLLVKKGDKNTATYRFRPRSSAALRR